jgi:hypothetical protein
VCPQPTGTGSGRASKRPPPLKKPLDADEEIRALAVDLGIWMDDNGSPRVKKVEVVDSAASTDAAMEGKSGEELVASPVSPSSLGHVEGSMPELMLPTRQQSRESTEDGADPSGGTSSPSPSPPPPLPAPHESSSSCRTSEDFNGVGDVPAASKSPQVGGHGGRAEGDGGEFWHRRQPLRSHLSPVWGTSLGWDSIKGTPYRRPAQLLQSAPCRCSAYWRVCSI